MESFTEGVFTAINGGGSLETVLAGAVVVATGVGTANNRSSGCWEATRTGVGVGATVMGESRDTRSGDDSTRRGLSTFKVWTSGNSDALCW